MMRIAKKCDADAPRYAALIMALNAIIDWIDIDNVDWDDSDCHRHEITICCQRKKSKWVSVSFSYGPLKDKNYCQIFRDENLCMLLSDTVKMNVEVKHNGVLYKDSFGYTATGITVTFSPTRNMPHL